MQCSWDAFLQILPHWLRDDVDRLSRNSLQELRLRVCQKPVLVTGTATQEIDRVVCTEDLHFCINMASRYSPWSASTMQHGYITAAGGHRLGICGISAQDTTGSICMQSVTSLCIRVARDFPGLSSQIKEYDSSILIIGKPGSGKTTLLRDLIRQRSQMRSYCIAVIDEKAEIFPFVHNQYCFNVGRNTDILTGCSKEKGIDAALRNMGPHTLAVDEITAAEDCQALLHAGWCGVRLLATAHAGNRQDLFNRSVYRAIINSDLFDTLIVMHSDMSWHAERMK